MAVTTSLNIQGVYERMFRLKSAKQKKPDPSDIDDKNRLMKYATHVKFVKKHLVHDAYDVDWHCDTYVEVTTEFKTAF